MANITLKQFLLHNVDGRSSKKIEDLYNVLDDVKTLLTNIKDVDGIKKILDTVAVSETELQSRVGDTNDAASAAGAVGSLAAKLRRLTIDLDDVQGKIGASSDALVDAGAVGSVSAKMRRLTKDLDEALTQIGDTEDEATEDSGVGTMSAKLRKIVNDLVTVLSLVQGMADQDLRGLETNKPEPGDVDEGTTYWSVDENTLEVSDGTNWILIGEVI